jgi:5-methylcytosine-specific restriction endonuclease McrA
MDERTPLDRHWEATIVDHLSLAVAELLDGSRDKADSVLREVSVRGPVRATRKGVPQATQLRVFRRDSFTCRYCSQRTLFLPTVRVLSEVFPEHLPVDPGWKLDHTHPVYWTLIASADHVVPAIRGGDSSDDNLVTSCWRCNDIKRAWSLQELRWTLLDLTDVTGWDGLSGAYAQLCAATTNSEGQPLSDASYHRGWLKAFGSLDG